MKLVKPDAASQSDFSCAISFKGFIVISALLITGGQDADDILDSVEMWAPDERLNCNLPSMVLKREYHTVTWSGLACGGYSDNDNIYVNNAVWTCDLWFNGRWEDLPNSLSDERHHHTAWVQPTTNDTFLIGGGDRSSNRTTKTSVERVETSVERVDLELVDQWNRCVDRYLYFKIYSYLHYSVFMFI